MYIIDAEAELKQRNSYVAETKTRKSTRKVKSYQHVPKEWAGVPNNAK